MGWMKGDSVCTPGGGRNYFIHHRIQTSSGARQSSKTIVIGNVLPGVKQPKGKADYSPLSNAHGRILGAVFSLLQTSSCYKKTSPLHCLGN
jgi:hypothetical protein